MKIKQEHLEYIRKEIDETLARYDIDKLIEEYETGKFPRSESVKDLQKRFCFDIMYGSGLTKYVCDNLYKYMNDSHIFTALKSICPTVTKKY